MKRFFVFCACAALLAALAACDRGSPPGGGGNGGGNTNPANSNKAPFGQDDSFSTDEEIPLDMDVLANDSDPDGDALNIGSFTQPAPGKGAVARVDNTLRYIPPINFNGVVTFTYVVRDEHGASDTAQVTITVKPVNDDPVAVNDNAVTPKNTPVNVAVLLNDTDVDGDILSVSSVGAASHGSTSINSDNTVRYEPDAGFVGNDSFNYTISDGQGGLAVGSVAISVTGVNEAPIANDDNFTTLEDTVASFNVLANDTDPDGDSLSVTITVQPLHGAATVNPNKSIGYTPNPDYNGPDNLTYMVNDGKGLTDTAVVIITVTPVNDAPVAVNDSAETAQPNHVIVDVLANDSDVDGDTLRVKSATQPANGGVAIQPDGTIKYTPLAGFEGQDSFTYVLTDRPDNSGLTSTGTVTITVKILTWSVAQTTPLYTQKETYAVVCEDFDGDGLQDIACADAGSGAISVFRCILATPGSAPQYASRNDYVLNIILPASLVAADINGDGLLDLVAGGLGGVQVLFNDPTQPGKFIVSVNSIGSAGLPFPFPQSLSAADINGDGKPDIVAGDATSGIVGVLINSTPIDNVADIPGVGLVRYTQMTLAQFEPGASIGYMWALTTADFDGDGKPDIAATYSREVLPGVFENIVGIMRNTSSKGVVSFGATYEMIVPGAAPQDLAAGDLNRNGKPDIALRLSDTGVLVTLNTSSPGSLSFGGFAAFAAASDDGATGFAGIRIADMDNDGALDIVVTNGRNNSVSILRNRMAVGASTAEFADQKEFAVLGVLPYKLCLKDLNGDGVMDIVATSEFSMVGGLGIPLTVLTGKLG